MIKNSGVHRLFGKQLLRWDMTPSTQWWFKSIKMSFITADLLRGSPPNEGSCTSIWPFFLTYRVHGCQLLSLSGSTVWYSTVPAINPASETLPFNSSPGLPFSITDYSADKRQKISGFSLQPPPALLLQTKHYNRPRWHASENAM